MRPQPRNLLFVSHANPEDNHFSQWLSLQLAKEGYRVWCDLTRLLGGEDFWVDIEDAIRSETGKFIYVLSRASNAKPGPLQEVHLALSVARTHGLKDFVIPLLVDDIAHTDINIQLARINAIPFRRGWAQGLRLLLEKLERDDLGRDARFSPDSVAAWWRMSRETDAQVIRTPEKYLSNWYAIRRLPEVLHLHFVTKTQGRLNPRTFSYPVRHNGRHLVSFASADDLQDGIPLGVSILDSKTIPTVQFMRGIHQPMRIAPQEAHNAIVDLLRQGWEQLIESAGMLKYQMGKRSIVGFLKDGQIHRNRVSIPAEFGGARYRGVVGYRSRKDVQGITRHRFWHFAIGSRPTLRPSIGYRIIPHVLFSDDGTEIWSNADRQHRARRRESRNWWNAEWRDRTLGIVQWLADEGQDISIPLGSAASIQVETRPISFISPVSYADPDPAQSLAGTLADLAESGNDEDGR